MWMMWMGRDRMMALLAATSAACLGSCVNFPTAAEAGVSYATEVVPWPTELECLNSANPTVAKEVLDQGTLTIVIAGGDNAISDAEWASYTPSWGHSKNSDRHLRFDESCFWRSPASAASCVGDDCRSIVEFDEHSWVELSKIHAVDCVPRSDDCNPSSVKKRSSPSSSPRNATSWSLSATSWNSRAPMANAPSCTPPPMAWSIWMFPCPPAGACRSAP